MSNFITNSKKNNLKKRIIELITKSNELKFLVAFFYFLGIREFYNSLKNNKKVNIKVLVGLNVDKFNFSLIEIASDNKLSVEEKKEVFFRSVEKSINTESCDHKNIQEQIKFFTSLIKSNRLVIRKTFNPNHAKLYIFKLTGDQVGKDQLFITGSSNLTKAGLSFQNEFNVEISDYGFKEAEQYFDELWNIAIPITEDKITKKKLIEVLENNTLIKEITPFEAFLLVLKNYLDSFKQEDDSDILKEFFESANYIPYRYQIDAVSQAISIIRNNNGVILADVVGLGKTIMACAIAKALRKRGVVVCPPGIMGDPRKKDGGWNMYKEQFGLYDWEIWSLGDLEKLQDYIAKSRDVEVIIIDEAHRFRNQDTKNYEYLKNICRGKIVILLTATPFNNKPGDILSLLKLFITPKKSSITLEDNLLNKFRSFKGEFDRLAYIKKYFNSTDPAKKRKAQHYYQNLFGDNEIDPAQVKERSRYLARQIRDVIEPVTIRRNRLDLQNNPYYKNEVKDLSKVADPKEWFFQLRKEQSEFYDKVIKYYFANPEEGGKFKGAIYRPFEYEKEIKDKQKLGLEENKQFIQQRNLYDFMRRLLVKRFESSFGSFEQSIRNFKDVTEKVKKFIETTDKYILDRDLLEKIYTKSTEEIEDYLKQYSEKITKGEYPKSHKIYEIKKLKHSKEFVSDIESDLKLFKNVLDELKTLSLLDNDPKANYLVKQIKEILSQPSKNNEPKRKIVIFSEYVDTVLYLNKKLKKEFGDRLLTVAGNLSQRNIESLYENFDASYKDQKDDFDILLTSDKLSEGFNLNRAGMIINYDIPWNPVRVIQRLGRINRIGNKIFEELYIVNFFPTEQGASLVRSREIAASKMFLIHSTLGEDSKIFDIDEKPTPAGLYHRLNQNPDKLEGESFYTKAVNMFDKIRRENPDLVKSLDNYPPRVKVAKKSKKNEMFVFVKKRRLYTYGVSLDTESPKPYYVTLEDIIDKIQCSQNEKRLKFSDKAWGVYEKVKNFRERRNIPTSEQSLETRALNNLNHFIGLENESLITYKKFLRTLREDIADYGTLPDYTLRRIANLSAEGEEKLAKSIQEIRALENELGESYLEKEKQHQNEIQKEIIVAIENRKNG